MLLLMSSAGCGKKEKAKPGPDSELASFDGGRVTVSEFMIVCEDKVPTELKQRQRIVSGLIKDKLLAQMAHAEGLVSGQALASEMERIRVELLPGVLRKNITDNIKVSDEEIESYGKAGETAVLDVTMFVAKTLDGAEQSLKEVKAGKEIADVVNAHPDYFIESAKTDRQISMNDDLYPVGVRAALNRLKPGELSPIMKLEVGYAVFRLDKRTDPEELWAQKKASVAEELKGAKAKKELDDLVAKLYSQADIKISKIPGGYTATVDGMTISHEEVMSTETSSDPHAPHAGMTEKTVLTALDNTIRDYLLSKEAIRRGLDKDPAYRKRYDLATAKLLSQQFITRLNEGITVTEKDVADYYENNKQKLASEDLARVSRIQLDDAATAREVVAKLRDGGDFAKIAAQYSRDTETGPKGGDVGWLKISILKEPLQETLYNLKVGEVSDPVRSDYGYEVLTVTERKPSVVPPFEEVHDTIRKRVLLERRSEKLEALLGRLFKEKKVRMEIETLKAL